MIMNLISFVDTTYVINDSILSVDVCMGLDGQTIIQQALAIIMAYWLSVLRYLCNKWH
jgi:hypothetical protein